LFFDVARIAKAKKPPVIVLENVKNLLSHDQGRTFEIIRTTLEKDLGYKMSYRVFDARSFVPQHRERVIIVATKGRQAFDFDDVKVPRNSPRLSEILHSDETDFNWEPRFLNERNGDRVLCIDSSILPEIGCRPPTLTAMAAAGEIVARAVD
jgi:DNA (cytosine-5)-methyltransferase 1